MKEEATLIARHLDVAPDEVKIEICHDGTARHDVYVVQHRGYLIFRPVESLRRYNLTQVMLLGLLKDEDDYLEDLDGYIVQIW